MGADKAAELGPLPSTIAGMCSGTCLPRGLAAALLSFALAACSGCSGGARDLAPPNVVVVCIDTVRADHTSLHGYDRPTTPNLERIAANGLVLGHHFANASWTKPSVASIITGLHPSAHGSRVGQFSAKKKQQFVEVLADANVTMAEVFRDEGYHTVAHVTNYNMLARFGYDQGYEEYQFVEGATGDQKVNGSDREAVEFALEALRSADRPVFAWVHMMSVHQYIAPEDERPFAAGPGEVTPVDEDATAFGRVRNYDTIEAAVADYDNAIRYTDKLVGELYDTLRAEHPNTILVVTSDHGEEFYEHGGFEHASTLYNEMLRVPAILTGPGVPVGRTAGITDSIDLLPTLYELCTGELEAGMFRGQTVVANGELVDGKPATFAEQHHRGPYRRFALVQEGQKLIRSERKKNGKVSRELFDEPFAIEGADRSSEADPELIERFEAHIDLLHKAAKAHHDRHVGDTATEELSEEDIAALRALGYVE